MTHGSLFSGIGGFDLAAQWMGWHNEFHCEWNEFGRRVLQYYWPNAKSYEDITKTDFTIWRGKIDILTGGFPCQPYSQAGKRLGKEDDRHLWPEMLRAIREIRPTWVVGENVLGLVNWNGGLVFEEVQADLEAEGYEVQSYVLPAAGVNSPHKRERIWIVAYGDATDSHCGRLERSEEIRRNGINVKRESGDSSQRRATPNPHNERLQRSENKRSIEKSGENGKQLSAGCVQSAWDEFPTQSPVCMRNDGLSARLDGITFPKWRNESIKAGGNAIVPQVAYQIFQAIRDFEGIN